MLHDKVDDDKKASCIAYGLERNKFEHILGQRFLTGEDAVFGYLDYYPLITNSYPPEPRDFGFPEAARGVMKATPADR